MVCPSRKNLMLSRMKRSKFEDEKEKVKEEAPITEEEHKRRIKLLKDMGIIK